MTAPVDPPSIADQLAPLEQAMRTTINDHLVSPIGRGLATTIGQWADTLRSIQ